jgi:predicted RNA-binding protein with TRAM domain
MGNRSYTFEREVGCMVGIAVPVEEGTEYEVTIDAQGTKGDGIAHIEGFVIFIPNAKIGEKIKIKITALRRTFAVGERV